VLHQSCSTVYSGFRARQERRARQEHRPAAPLGAMIPATPEQVSQPGITLGQTLAVSPARIAKKKKKKHSCKARPVCTSLPVSELN